MAGRHKYISHFDVCETCSRHGHATTPSGKIGPEVASQPDAHDSFELMRRNKVPGMGMAGVSLLRGKVPLDWPKNRLSEEEMRQILAACEEKKQAAARKT